MFLAPFPSKAAHPRAPSTSRWVPVPLARLCWELSRRCWEMAGGWSGSVPVPRAHQGACPPPPSPVGLPCPSPPPPPLLFNTQENWVNSSGGPRGGKAGHGTSAGASAERLLHAWGFARRIRRARQRQNFKALWRALIVQIPCSCCGSLPNPWGEGIKARENRGRSRWLRFSGFRLSPSLLGQTA